MRRALVLVLAAVLLVQAPLASAGETILAREEIQLSVNDDAEAAAKTVLTKAIESAKKHPCYVTAEKEGRSLDIFKRYFTTVFITGSDIYTAKEAVEVVTENC